MCGPRPLRDVERKASSRKFHPVRQKANESVALLLDFFDEVHLWSALNARLLHAGAELGRTAVALRTVVEAFERDASLWSGVVTS
jgi:hypothetical protein